MANTKKKNSNKISDSENKITEFPKFIVIESLEETPPAKLSPFLIEKNNLEQSKPLNCEKKTN